MPLLMCPNDNAAMQTLERGGVQFDMCPTCRGVWLDRGELEKLMRSKRWDFVQLNYSLAEPEAEERLLPLAAELGVAVIVNRPFAQGSLFSKVKSRELPGWASEIGCTSWAQVFLKWILANPAVTCVIPASSKVAHTMQNMLAGTGRMPDAALRARIAREIG